ncbi:hypothetical protein GCM10009624_34290 [Gordonia sinesedis]
MVEMRRIEEQSGAAHRFLSFDNAGKPQPTLNIDQWKSTSMATAAEHKSTAENLAAEARDRLRADEHHRRPARKRPLRRCMRRWRR